uniref:Uncharacterized protein n=1 Tax=Rhizophora mucronata TaxID=61149 RepID=A0A2P2PDX2_RHIMU
MHAPGQPHSLFKHLNNENFHPYALLFSFLFSVVLFLKFLLHPLQLDLLMIIQAFKLIFS